MRKAEWKYIYRGACAVILILVAAVMFAFTWKDFVEENNTTGRLLGTGNMTVSISIYVLLFFLIGKALRMFKIGVERTVNLLASVVLSVLTVNILETLISAGILGMPSWIGQMMGMYAALFLVQSVVLCMLAYGMLLVYRRLFAPLRILEVFRIDDETLRCKIDALRHKYHVCARMAYTEESQQAFREQMQKYDAVLINDLPSHQKNQILKICLDMNKRAYLVPKISDVIVRSSEQINLIDTPLFLCRNIGIGKAQRIVKRCMDLLLSLLGIVVFSPVMLLVAIAIRLDDGGPVLFRQERVTLDEKRFMILKFRSMRVDAEKDGKPHPAGEKDDRITRVGRFIRATRIDELPQLFNILMGEMSIVGPRPERVEHVEKYTREIPEFSLRSKVKGGLTGYAQVYGKYNTSALDKLKMDLIYITNYSPLLDIQILFETIKILFQKESTEGFKESKIREIHDEHEVRH